MTCDNGASYTSPPRFSELGERANALFNENYYFGFLNLMYKTKNSSGIEIGAYGSRNLESKKTDAHFEGKFNISRGHIKEKWTISNLLETSISLNNMFFRGLTVDLDCLIYPHTGKRSGGASLFYKRPGSNMLLNFKHEYGCMNGDVSAMVSRSNWYFGWQTAYNITNRELGNTDFAIGYLTDNFSLNTNLQNFVDFTGSLYHRVNEQLESGVQLAWSAEHNSTSFALGCNFNVDAHTSFTIKINNLSQVGFSLSNKFSRCFTLTLCSFIDGSGTSQGGHKIGLGLKLAN